MQRDKNKWICDYCYKTCKTCTGSESTDCISCNVNYIFTTKNKCESKIILLKIKILNKFLKIKIVLLKMNIT